MGVRRLTLPSEPPRVGWGVEGLFPRGHASLLWASQGQGKVLMGFLAVQAARPEGKGSLAERPVRHGRTLLLDAEDPKGWGYILWVNRFLNAHPDADRGLVDLRAVERGLTPEDVAALEAELKGNPPAFLVLDGVSNALLGVDAGSPRRAAATLRAPAALAQDLDLTLLLLEEKDRPSSGAFSRGLLGEALRAASPAALFSLERVPPREAEGREVVRLVALTQRYAPLPSPLGLELVEGHGGEGWSLEPYPLLEGKTLVARAEAAILRALREAGEEGLPRKVLLEDVMAQASVSERTAKTALAHLRTRGKVKEVALGGRGNPKAYRLVDSKYFFAQKGESALRSGADFGQSPLPQRVGEADPGEGRGTLEPLEEEAGSEWEVEL
ncbi:AAA family ATPase [Thermus arciformis]|nr:AAA family ATPase [Thermus arciformis]